MGVQQQYGSAAPQPAARSAAHRWPGGVGWRFDLYSSHILHTHGPIVDNYDATLSGGRIKQMPVIILPFVDADTEREYFNAAAVVRKNQREHTATAHHTIIVRGVFDIPTRVAMHLGERLPVTG